MLRQFRLRGLGIVDGDIDTAGHVETVVARHVAKIDIDTVVAGAFPRRVHPDAVTGHINVGAAFAVPVDNAQAQLKFAVYPGHKLEPKPIVIAGPPCAGSFTTFEAAALQAYLGPGNGISGTIYIQYKLDHPACTSFVKLVLDTDHERTGLLLLFLRKDDVPFKRHSAVVAECTGVGQLTVAMPASGKMPTNISGGFRMDCGAHGITGLFSHAEAIGAQAGSS